MKKKFGPFGPKSDQNISFQFGPKHKSVQFDTKKIDIRFSVYSILDRTDRMLGITLVGKSLDVFVLGRLCSSLTSSPQLHNNKIQAQPNSSLGLRRCQIRVWAVYKYLVISVYLWTSFDLSLQLLLHLWMLFIFLYTYMYVYTKIARWR